jgi:putative ABC transport system permease protein
MDLSESFLTAFDSLLNNKLRAILTMLGVIIGVGAVIALMAVGNGFKVYMTQQIQSMGSNLLTINTDNANSDGYPVLTMDDVDALLDKTAAPDILDVAATVQSNRSVAYDTTTLTVPVTGVTVNYFAMSNQSGLDEGELFTQADVDSHTQVAVLGATAADDLFGENYPIGQSLRINGGQYRVIGVLTSKGGGQFSPDDRVYIPLTTAQRYLNPQVTRKGMPAVSSIVAQAASQDVSTAASSEITSILRTQHNQLYVTTNDFRIQSQNDLLSTITTLTSTLTMFLGAIAGISLLVGGIGIMNIMLVSVTERTREIGIRKAVGAQRRDVLIQFMIEALALSLMGGLLGTLVGWGVSKVIGPVVNVTAVVDFGTILLANSVAAAIGLVFGIYPAWRAARLRPIEALRYE